MNELSESEIKARVKVLRVIAERYHELVDPMLSATGVRGSGDRLPLSPHEPHCLVLTREGHGRRCTCAYRTVTEFERLMAQMRYDRHTSLILTAPGEKHSLRRLRWHILAWYTDATIVRRHVPVTVAKGKKLKVVRDQEILRDEQGQWVPSRLAKQTFRLPGARQALADAGLRWMAVNWGLRHSPELPAAEREVSDGASDEAAA